MGRVSESWRDVRDRSVIQEFGGLAPEAYPEISALMAGKPFATGTGWERPPLTLWLFAEGNTVRWCFSASDFSMQLWGACPSLATALDDIEGALCKENCSWRKKTHHDNGFTRHK